MLTESPHFCIFIMKIIVFLCCPCLSCFCPLCNRPRVAFFKQFCLEYVSHHQMELNNLAHVNCSLWVIRCFFINTYPIGRDKLSTGTSPSTGQGSVVYPYSAEHNCLCYSVSQVNSIWLILFGWLDLICLAYFQTCIPACTICNLPSSVSISFGRLTSKKVSN